MSPTKLKTSTTLFFAGTIAILLLAYGPAIPGPFFIVDDGALVNIPQLSAPLSVELLSTWFTPGSHVDFYPLRDFSYWIDIHLMKAPISGEVGTIFRLHNLALFTLIAILLYLILIELKCSPAWALGTSLLWFIHPVHAETVLWISGRKDLLAMAFASGSVLCYLKSSGKRSTHFLFASLLCYLASLLSKASFSLLPMVGIIILVKSGMVRAQFKHGVYLFIGLIFAAISSLFQSWFYSEFNDMRFYYPWNHRLFGALVGLGKMLSGWFYYPLNTVDLFNWGAWAELNSHFFWVGLVFFILFAYGLYHYRHNNFLFFPLCGFFLLYLPISGMAFPHRNFYSVRYFEAPALTLIIGLVSYFWHREQKWQLRKNFGIAGLILMPFLLWGDFHEGYLWSDNLKVIQRAKEHTPDNNALLTLELQELTNLRKWRQLDEGQLQEMEKTKSSLAGKCLPLLDQPMNKTGDLCSVYFAHRIDQMEVALEPLDSALAAKMTHWLEELYLLRTKHSRAQMNLTFALSKLQAPPPSALPSASKEFFFRSPTLETKEIGRIKIWLGNCHLGHSETANRYIESAYARSLVRSAALKDRTKQLTQIYSLQPPLNWNLPPYPRCGNSVK